jgi:VWFA-related protein
MVLHFDVNLVQVDVVVTDSKGGRVPGLGAEDFEVLQDGEPQKISHFSYSARRPADAVASTAPAAGRALTRDQVRRTFVLMLDDANMAFADFHDARQALQRFVDEGMENGDMAAVVRTRVGSGTSQLFTFDRQWLHRTLERMVWRPPLPLSRAIPPLPTVLTSAIRALAGFPGRKSILLISPGFPASNWYQERTIADLANRSSVTIEAIDARGLPTLAASAATHLGDDSPSGLGMSAEHSRPFPDPAAGVQRLTRYIHSQDALVFLADMTAGRFLHDKNDMYAQVKANDAPSIGPKGLVPRDSMTPGHTAIGSASEVIEIPDLKKDEFALTGITLWGEAGAAALPAAGTTFRPLASGDSAVRQFHAGETVKYLFRLVRDPRKPAEAVAVQIQVAHDRKNVFASEPRPVQTGETVEGWYKLDASLDLRQYLLGAQATKPGSKSAPMTQWIDFEVTK